MSVVREGVGPGGEPVAVKRMRDGAEADRVRREAEALAAVAGVGVPALVALAEEDDGPALMMERLVGEPLSRRLAARRLALDQVRAIGLGIAAVLERAHARGWSHRDVKPDNVFLCEDGRLILLDWGVAIGPGASVEARVPGTPGFVPPELRAGGPVAGPVRDRYALAVTLLQAATGLRAPDGGTEAELATVLLAAGLPVDWRAWFTAGLHPDPTRRTRDTRALREGLEGLGQSAVDAVPTSTSVDLAFDGPAAPVVRATGGGIAAALAGVALLAGLAWWGVRSALPAAESDAVDVARVCRDLATALGGHQRDDGGFAGTPHGVVSAWDTAQQVSALVGARERCGLIGHDPAIERGLQRLVGLREPREGGHAVGEAWAVIAGAPGAREAIQRFRAPGGAFALWQGGEPHPYATVMALLALPPGEDVGAAARWLVHEESVRRTPGLDEQAFVALARHDLVPAGYGDALRARIAERCGDEACTHATDGRIDGLGSVIVLQWVPWACQAARALRDEDLESRCRRRLLASDPSLPGYMLAERVIALAALTVTPR